MANEITFDKLPLMVFYLTKQLSELRRALRRYKIDTEFKLNRRTGEAEGVKFICNGY